MSESSSQQEQTPQEQTPQEQTPQEQTPQEQTPQEQTPQEQTPQEQTPQEQVKRVQYISKKELELWTEFVNSLKDDEIPISEEPESSIELTEEGEIIDKRTDAEKEFAQKKHDEYCDKMHKVTCKFSTMVPYPYNTEVPRVLPQENHWLDDMLMYFHESGMSEEAYNEYQAEQQSLYEYQHYRENQEPDIDED
jgi:hypothetical protein